MDHRLKIKSYTPDSSTYSPRISTEQWDQYKPLLKHLHGEGYKRAAMLDIIRKQGFNPSMGQLNAKMTAWGFKVYGTQSEPQDHDQGFEAGSRLQSFNSSDTTMDEAGENELAPSPSSRRSFSSTTLCESERTINTQPNDRSSSLDEVITQQVMALSGRYWPATRLSDFGIKWSDNTSGHDQSSYRSIISIADFFRAVHCFEQAFDLYQQILEHFVCNNLDKYTSLVRCLIQCAISATSEAQCSYVSSIVRHAHVYCIEHAMVELVSCFSALLSDLCPQEVKGKDSFVSSPSNRASDMALLIATDSEAKIMAYDREWLQQLLSQCDDAHSTLAHLSTWCQETLSFYKLENQVIVRSPPKTASDGMQEMASFEHDFQTLASALVIDYLNSPGPKMKKANVECKENDCLFRSALSPSTSLIIMAHLLYEPLRLQSQNTSNSYLLSRAQHFATVQSMTALQELRSFETVGSNVRCGAFVDTFMKHFVTSLDFRRFAASMNIDSWDRVLAAKRLGHLLQNNQSGVLPHAGLPGSRRTFLKTMAAPFGLDQSLSEGRGSVASDSGSMGDFERLSHQIGGPSGPSGTLTPSDAMSIDTRSSWSFHRVTGFAAGGLSHSNSMSSRGGLSHTNSVASRARVDQDEMEEYRDFIKQNNYSQQSLTSNTDSTTQRFPTPTVKDFTP